MVDCVLCRGAGADVELDRVEVWRDGHWRLTVSLSAEVEGFAYLEPHRHISHIHALDGEELATLGPALARCTGALRDATGADVVYLYVFGDGVPHLHFHLAPHRSGDALNDRIIRGDIVEEKLANGLTRFYSETYPALPRDRLAQIAGNIRDRLKSSAPPTEAALGGHALPIDLIFSRRLVITLAIAAAVIFVTFAALLWAVL
jgi:diadenosine tetraphosphate (Ap4A) HIT family hydrolase